MSVAARHGFLALGLCLLACHAAWMARLGWKYEDRHLAQACILLALILNHLAFRFPWPREGRIALRAVAVLWLGATAFLWVRVMLR